ncbi:uncharacterized protein LOC135960936 isoform X5 [Calliphora vicina]|uniref:uncharacterized protein LOC135960936 isoform X5 n=1 Tax=Calliphora vicina TaxID=7373 RepID=UPI00325A801B
MLISDIVYLIFLMVLLFIIIYKGFSFSSRSNEQDGNFNATRDELYYNRHCLPGTDRQGNNFAVPDETGRDTRYNDIFFIEPNSPEAARIRSQLEKDDKDLPSYDEVMRMTNLSTPTAAPAADNFVPAMPSALSMAASSSSVNTTDTTLSVPPYNEANPNVSSSVRPLTPPPYTPEPIGATVVLPITTPLHSQQHTQSS